MGINYIKTMIGQQFFPLKNSHRNKGHQRKKITCRFLGAEALAQNFDHYNTFTEYTMRQVLEYSRFREVKVIPLNLYVFYKNPVNYVLIALSKTYSLFFTFSFMLYGKSNRVWTKKIAAVCKKKGE